MGFDIYVGTLTRYYAQNWKSVTQQWAEANGFAFSKITYDTESLAKFAFSIFWQAMRFAEEQQVPVLLDF